MTYTLNVQISQADLETIDKANQNVVLIKVVPDGQHKVTWVTFKPFQQNQATWESTYFLYASLSDPVEGNQITVNSNTVAQARYDYTFSSNLSFSNGQYNQQLADGQYGVINNVPTDQQPWLTFGMAQTCTVNGKENAEMPINAEVVPAQQFSKYTPTETILIFLASDVGESTVFDNVIIGSTKSPALDTAMEAQTAATELSFSPSIQTITVLYSANLGKFVQQ